MPTTRWRRRARSMPVPDGLDLSRRRRSPRSGSRPISTCSARPACSPARRCCVHGGASGVGTAAIQLAKALGPSPVIVTVGSADKAEACRALGADHAILYKDEDFSQRVLEHHRRQARRRRDPRPHRRQVPRAQPRLPRALRPPRDHRPARRRQGRAQHRPPDGQAPADHRLGAARPPGRGEGADHGGVPRAGAAALRDAASSSP